MARLFALVSLLAALGTVGLLVSTQRRANERTSPGVVTTAVDAAASINLQQAASALESAKALGGSYAGVDVSGFGVRVARADDSSYCIEAGALHVAGPGGAPSPGGC